MNPGIRPSKYKVRITKCQHCKSVVEHDIGHYFNGHAFVLYWQSLDDDIYIDRFEKWLAYLAPQKFVEFIYSDPHDVFDSKIDIVDLIEVVFNPPKIDHPLLMDTCFFNREDYFIENGIIRTSRNISNEIRVYDMVYLSLIKKLT